MSKITNPPTPHKTPPRAAALLSVVTPIPTPPLPIKMKRKRKKTWQEKKAKKTTHTQDRYQVCNIIHYYLYTHIVPSTNSLDDVNIGPILSKIIPKIISYTDSLKTFNNNTSFSEILNILKTRNLMTTRSGIVSSHYSIGCVSYRCNEIFPPDYPITPELELAVFFAGL